MDYDWCLISKVATFALEKDFCWHMVAPASAKTVCGISAANPDEEWRWVGSLGQRRPCHRCADIMARRADQNTG